MLGLSLGRTLLDNLALLPAAPVPESIQQAVSTVASLGTVTRRGEWFYSASSNDLHNPRVR